MRNEDPKALKKLAENLNQWKISEQKDMDELKTLLKGRLDIAAVFIPEYVNLKSNLTLFSELLNQEDDDSFKLYRCACFVSKALSKGVDLLDIQKCIEGIKDIDINTVLTTPIRVGAGMVHHPTEFANIKQLIAILKYKTFESKIIERTLDRLSFLAEKKRNHVEIANAGAIPTLVDLLSTGTEKVKANAAKALMNLAQNPEIQTKIVLPGLIDLLSYDSPTAKETAAGALWNLAVMNPENRTKIVAAGALQPLVNLLQSGSDEAKETAAGALMNLAFENPENRSKIVAEGALQPLVNLLKVDQMRLKELLQKRL